MVLQLYVWGPAFGLPSIDAECLAAIAFLAQTTSPSDYQLIQTSPSAVPTQHLPALHDPSTSTWTAGYPSITTHLQSHPPPTFHDPSPPSTTTATTTADDTAYTSFLTQHAAPLLALSLYVSSANYTTTTRPAYSTILPLPLPWTEPPQLRAAMARRAAHLGLSSLDTDALAERERMEEKRVQAEGWVSVPSSLQNALRAKKGGVGGLLGPEERRRIKLEGLAEGVMDVLGEVEWEGRGVGVRCLAWAYLALMVVPDVPRPWLREVMEGRYPGLFEFVRGFRWEVFGDRARELPWVEDAAGGSAVKVGVRFARGVMCEVPGIGGLWSRWWTARKKRQALARKGIKTGSSGDFLVFASAALAVVAASAGVFFYRGLPPFGAAVQTWRKPLVGLGRLGAAGAIFSGAFYG